jgi:ankyrin repeat protein
LPDGTRRAREGTECFQVLSDSIIRRDADPASEIVDKRLRAGDTIIALEAVTVENADGNDVLRVHVESGWCSTTAKDGTRLLAVMTEAERRRYFETPPGAKKRTRFLRALGLEGVAPKSTQDSETRIAPKPKWQLRLEAEQKARALVLFQTQEEAEHLERLEAAQTIVPTMNEVTNWLRQHRLAHFAIHFEGAGYDDLNFLAEMDTPAFTEMMAVVGTGMKKGHVLKLRQAFEKLRAQSNRHYVVQSVMESIVHTVALAEEAEYGEPDADTTGTKSSLVISLEDEAVRQHTEQVLCKEKERTLRALDLLINRAETAEAHSAALATLRHAAENKADAAMAMEEKAILKAHKAATERASMELQAEKIVGAKIRAEADAKAASTRRQSLEKNTRDAINTSKTSVTELEAVAKLLKEASIVGSREEEEAARVEETARQVIAGREQVQADIAADLNREQSASLQSGLDAEAATNMEKRATLAAAQAYSKQKETVSMALWNAAKAGNEIVINELIRDGIDGVKPPIDTADRTGQTALSKAALANQENAVSLLLRLGANFESAPVGYWNVEQVCKWCKRQFRWFGKYEEHLVAAEIDGEALLEYKSDEDGVSHLKDDMKIRIAAHARVLLAKLDTLRERDEKWTTLAARARNQQEQNAATVLADAAATKATVAARATLVEAQLHRREAEAQAAAEMERRRQMHLPLRITAPIEDVRQKAQLSQDAAVWRKIEPVQLGGAHSSVPDDPIPEEEDTDQIELRIRTPSGSWLKVRVGHDRLVTELKWKIQEQLKVPMAKQTLLFKLRELLDTQTLAAANLDDKAIVHLRCPTVRALKIVR